MIKLTNRCMGECCEDIGLTISPRKIRDEYLYWKNYQKILTMSFEDDFIDKWGEIYLIYPMLIFLKSNYRHPENPKKKSVKLIYHYTCKHFDKKKRICTIYEDRPAMCRTYPNKEWCGNPKCRNRKYVKARERHYIKLEKELVETNEQLTKLLKKD